MLRKNVASQKVQFSLFKSGARIDNPTLAAGDIKVSIDGGAQANVATTPTSDAAGLVTWLPSQAETNGDYIALLAEDAAGDEWEPMTMGFDTRLSTIVWEATTRTLTSTAAEVADAVDGNDLTVTAAVSFDATITGLTIPATWGAIYLTAKSSESVADAAAWVQIVESNPADDDDGLLYLVGCEVDDEGDGTLTVNQSAGTIAIHLADNATAEFTRALKGNYDIKCLTSDGESQLLTYGAFTVQLTETRTI